MRASARGEGFRLGVGAEPAADLCGRREALELLLQPGLVAVAVDAELEVGWVRVEAAEGGGDAVRPLEGGEAAEEEEAGWVRWVSGGAGWRGLGRGGRSRRGGCRWG